MDNATGATNVRSTRANLQGDADFERRAANRRVCVLGRNRWREHVRNPGSLDQKARNIHWQVDTAAGLEAFSDFKATILAGTAIVVGASATLEGGLLASGTAVTFSGAEGRAAIGAAGVLGSTRDLRVGI